MIDPISLFTRWWAEARAGAPSLRQPGAVCLSTVAEDGAPTARFVDLKAVDPGGFVFCTALGSRKAAHLRREPRVALTCWWDALGRQVRVQGRAVRLSEEEAGHWWAQRSRAAQVATLASAQSRPLADEATLRARVEAVAAAHEGQPIPRPEAWGGYRVTPTQIEFLTFGQDRLHRRELFVRGADGAWRSELLQP